MYFDRADSDVPTLAHQYTTDHGSILRAQSAAAAHFAAVCSTLPGARVLRDVALDEVSLNFGDRTQEVGDRLSRRGYRVDLTEWRAQKTLRVRFMGESMATALELADALAIVLGEMDLADARVW